MPIEYVLSEHVQQRMVERGIRESWLVRTLENPDRHWRDPIDEELIHVEKHSRDFGDRALRVVYNDSGKPWLVVTVFLV